MKKKIITAVLTMSCVGFSMGSAFAQSCNGVTIQAAGSSTACASGLSLQVKNESGAACGPLAANALQVYCVADAAADRDYATALTGLSLQKKFYINTLAAGAYLDVLTAVVVKN